MDSGFLTPDEAANFTDIVDGYEPSDEAVGLFAGTSFAVIAGPAVSGKDTLREGLLSDYPQYYQKVLSLTTRRPRPGEEGTYEFVGVEEMIRRAEDKRLLQIALVHNQQVSATDVAVISNIAPGKIGLSILIVQAEQELYGLKPDMKTIFMVPPGFDELISRIRRDRVNNEDELNRRLASAKKEIEIALSTDRYYLLASDVQQNVRIKADEFLRLGKRDKKEEERSRDICRKILKRLS